MKCYERCIQLLLSIEELNDFKGRIKMLEEKNTAFVQKNLELEEVRNN